MSGRNLPSQTIKSPSCRPRKLVWPSTPPMPLSTPSSANRSMNPWASRTSPSPAWYARRTTARLAFSRSVRWRSLSGSLDRSLALEPALTFVLWTGVAACDGSAPMARARSLALKPALTFVLWTGVAACDGAAPMARARIAAAAKPVIVFQLGTFILMSSCGFQSLRSVATGLSPDVVTFASGTVRSRHRIAVIVESCRPEFLRASGCQRGDWPCPATRRGWNPGSLGPFPARFGLCRCHPVVRRGWRAHRAQRPGAEQGPGDDGAGGEDAGGPPERGVVAVRQCQPGQGLAADQPGRGEMRGDVGGDGAGEDGVQQRGADRAAEHLADGNGCGCD